MEKTVIDKILAVRYGGECIVNLRGMRADLSQAMRIKPSDIPSWFGVDERGYSVQYELAGGVTIYYDEIHTAARRLINPRFEP